MQNSNELEYLQQSNENLDESADVSPPEEYSTYSQEIQDEELSKRDCNSGIRTTYCVLYRIIVFFLQFAGVKWYFIGLGQ